MTKSTRRFAFLAALLWVTAVAGVAEAKSYHFKSKHPLGKKSGGGFCYIDAPHVHNFGPSEPRVYRQVDGEYYFVGDPAPYGYDGPEYVYYGAHPVVDASVELPGPIYCYLDGPHYHYYQPAVSAEFQLHGGAYFYVGTYAPVFQEERPRYAVINDVYRPMPYDRPVVDISVVPGDVRAHVMVVGPPVRVHGRAGIGLNVGIGFGFGPPPPPPPERVIIVREREEHVYTKRHRDNGKHKGWYK
jgi:hypothetical protein